jgi:ribonuclease HII
VDEVGYGPVAGPVVAAAVALRRGQRFEGAVDSKLLSAKRREELAGIIQKHCLAYGVAAASCREIERLNARNAAALAMRRALRHLPFEPDLLLVDGKRVPGLREHTPVVGGDLRCHSIACASIVAKVTRDRLMRRLGRRYPEYGWESNKGYRTAEHRAAIREFGPTAHHRRTFAGVLQVELSLDEADGGVTTGGTSPQGEAASVRA